MMTSLTRQGWLVQQEPNRVLKLSEAYTSLLLNEIVGYIDDREKVDQLGWMTALCFSNLAALCEGCLLTRLNFYGASLSTPRICIMCADLRERSRVNFAQPVKYNFSPPSARPVTSHLLICSVYQASDSAAE